MTDQETKRVIKKYFPEKTIREGTQNDPWIHRCKNCETYMPTDFILCDNCLLVKFNLEALWGYDNVDMPFVSKADALMIIRLLGGESE